VAQVALVGIPVFFNPGSSEQLTLGLIVCFLSFGLYMSLAPFKLDSDDLLQQACQVQIFFSLLSALVLKTETNSGAMGAILSVMLFIPSVFAQMGPSHGDAAHRWD
jgi:FtsH-binding integral membrane protein